MPTPFACHWCDKPTMNETGICIDCEQKYEEGNKEIAESVRELEARIRWLEDGLKQIASKTLGLDDEVQALLDGEPTTADESNVVYISDVNKEIAREWKKDTMQEDEKLVHEEQFGGDKFDGLIDLNDREREKKILRNFAEYADIKKEE